MAEVKITKKVVLEAIKAAAENGAEFGEVVSAADVVAFADTMIAQLDAKAAKAKEKAAEKKAEGDALRAAVEKVVGEEPATIDVITAAVKAEGFEDVTRSKVTARLTQLVKADMVHKIATKTEDGRKVMAYAAGPAPEEDAE